MGGRPLPARGVVPFHLRIRIPEFALTAEERRRRYWGSRAPGVQQIPLSAYAMLYSRGNPVAAIAFACFAAPFTAIPTQKDLAKSSLFSYQDNDKRQ